MAPSLGQLIVARAKRDPAFKKKTLTALYRKLAKTIPSTAEWQRLDRAITALENMK
jgi:hypothetical protein